MTPEGFTVCCVLCCAGTLNGNNENSYMLQQLEAPVGKSGQLNGHNLFYVQSGFVEASVGCIVLILVL